MALIGSLSRETNIYGAPALCKHALGILLKLSYLILKNHPKLSYLYIMETLTERIFITFSRSHKWLSYGTGIRT